MDRSRQGSINTAGGAVFQGPLNADRDINISHVSYQIYQTVQRLSTCCERRDVSEWLRGKISTFRTLATVTEERARKLQINTTSDDPELALVFSECKDVLEDLERLAQRINSSDEGSTSTHLHESNHEDLVRDIWTRLCMIQSCLNAKDARTTREEFAAIRDALQKWSQDQDSTREASIYSFYTAQSIPTAEREEWKEIERTLRQYGVTPQLFQQYSAFILESIGDIIQAEEVDGATKQSKDQDSVRAQAGPLHQPAFAAERESMDEISVSAQVTLFPSPSDDMDSSNAILMREGHQPIRSDVPRIGVSVLHDTPDATIDIVFVHTHSGHPLFSWMYRFPPETIKQESTNRPDGLRSYFRRRPPSTQYQKVVVWPTDLLPEDFHQARILSFGFESPVVSRRTGYGTSILNRGQELLYDLLRIRESSGDDSSDRPIIFIAHGIGGLLVKDALRRSLYSTDMAGSIFEHTQGVIFMGTPHRGQPVAEAAGRYVRILSLAGLKFDSNLVTDLKPGSPILQMLHEEFINVLRRGTIRIWTFLEEFPLALPKVFSALGFKDKVVPDWSGRVDHPTEIVTHLHVSHQQLCKFTGRDDPGYRAVCNALRSIVVDIEVEEQERA